MKDFIVVNGKTLKPGMYLRVDHMDDKNGEDWQATLCNGKIGVIKKIDDMGTIFGSWDGLGVIPEVDIFTVSDNLNDLLNEANVSTAQKLNNALDWIDEHCVCDEDYEYALEKIGYPKSVISALMKQAGRSSKNEK